MDSHTAITSRYVMLVSVFVLYLEFLNISMKSEYFLYKRFKVKVTYVSGGLNTVRMKILGAII
jgi:hypothetical protein